MESWFPARETLISVESGGVDKIVSTTTKDQNFLLHFIMGAYFGPHLKEEPHKSVFQRRAERLPLYTYDQLAGSHIRTVEIERIYFYILRKADPSLVLQLRSLHQFLHGNLQSGVGNPVYSYPQFGALFPPRLHPHSRFSDQYDMIFNIVFINEPETYYMHPAVIEKFKKLTHLDHVHVDRDRATTYTLVGGEYLHNVPLLVEAKGLTQQQDVHILEPIKSGLHLSGSPDCDLPFRGTISSISSSTSKPVDHAEDGVLFLPARPSEEEWSNIAAATKNGVALTGSAATVHAGPVLGLLDIGECDDSFLFHVSLPGVKRDEKEFNCEVMGDGTVLLKGVTVGGESTVHRYSQVFEMQSQNICPPGPFSMSFKLPGPVDPRQFSGNFGTDGILEGLVMKTRSQG